MKLFLGLMGIVLMLGCIGGPVGGTLANVDDCTGATIGLKLFGFKEIEGKGTAEYRGEQWCKLTATDPKTGKKIDIYSNPNTKSNQLDMWLVSHDENNSLIEAHIKNGITTEGYKDGKYVGGINIDKVIADMNADINGGGGSSSGNGSGSEETASVVSTEGDCAMPIQFAINTTKTNDITNGVYAYGGIQSYKGSTWCFLELTNLEIANAEYLHIYTNGDYTNVWVEIKYNGDVINSHVLYDKIIAREVNGEDTFAKINLPPIPIANFAKDLQENSTEAGIVSAVSFNTWSGN